MATVGTRCKQTYIVLQTISRNVEVLPARVHIGVTDLDVVRRGTNTWLLSVLSGDVGVDGFAVCDPIGMCVVDVEAERPGSQAGSGEELHGSRVAIV